MSYGDELIKVLRICYDDAVFYLFEKRDVDLI